MAAKSFFYFCQSGEISPNLVTPGNCPEKENKIDRQIDLVVTDL